jgi:hypothetical protein
MDPYLESPIRWESVHNQLISALPGLLEPLLPERYAISVEERVYLTLGPEGTGMRKPDALILDTSREPIRQPPTAAPIGGVAVLIPDDDPVRELFLTIRDMTANDEIVTVVEILSPTNKQPGPAREQYLQKRGAILASRASLVEIDLLRGGERMPVREAPSGYDYSILASRPWERPRAFLVPFALRQPLPDFPVPLRSGDVEPIVNLSEPLRRIYSSNRLHRRIDYKVAPEPALRGDDAAWADALLREAGLR